MAEHRSPKPGVAGSIPVSPATIVSTAANLKIVLTGHPGSGKTTTMRGIVERHALEPDAVAVLAELFRDEPGHRDAAAQA